MKRITYVFVALALMLAFLPTTVFAHTEGDPHVVDLIAGQYMDVGDVKVWNDATNLYMEFVLDGDWCLKETHVAVGEIPMTKKGNPIPGQFPYFEEFELTACELDKDYFDKSIKRIKEQIAQQRLFK